MGDTAIECNKLSNYEAVQGNGPDGCILVGDTEPEPGIMSSSEINVHVPEPSVQEGDEDVLDLIVGDTEPEPRIMSSSEINVHVHEPSVQEGGEDVLDIIMGTLNLNRE